MKKYWDMNSGGANDYDAVSRRKGQGLYTPQGVIGEYKGPLADTTN